MSLILNMLSNDIKQSQRRYQQFVMKNVGLENPLEKSYKNIVLGSEKFIERIKNKIDSLGGQNREISHIKDASLPSIIEKDRRTIRYGLCSFSQAAKRFESEMKKNKIALKMEKEVAEALKRE